MHKQRQGKLNLGRRKTNFPPSSIRITAFVMSFLLTVIPVSAAGAEVDRESPYTGDVIAAVNVNTEIKSDEELYASVESVGLDSIWDSGGAAGREPDRAEEVKGNKCGMQTVLREAGMEMPALNDLPEMPSAFSNFSYTEGDTREIVTPLHRDELEDGRFTAEVIAIGETCTIWADKNYKDGLDNAGVRALVDEIDGNIAPVLLDSFGDSKAADVDQDGKTAFVIYPFSDDGICGFFNPVDVVSGLGEGYEEYKGKGSDMDVLHINQTFFGSSILYSTIAHENQHLIHFALTRGDSDAWLNEVFSENAQALAGYGNEAAAPEANQAIDAINAAGVAYPFVFAGGYVPDSAEPYGQWYLFGRYLAAQTEGLPGGGSQIYGTILKTAVEEGGSHAVCNAEYLMKTLASIGYEGPASFEDLLVNYHMALLLRRPEGLYSIAGDEENPSLVDDIELNPIIPLRDNERMEKIPGGGAACYVSSPGQTEPSGYGEHIKYAAAELKEVVSDKEPGYLQPGEQISLSARGRDTQIYYTTDGTDPAADIDAAYKYESPITVSPYMVLRACAYYGEYGKYSPSYTWEYHVRPAKVTASPAMTDEVQPLLVPEGTFVTLSCETEGAKIYYSTEEGVAVLDGMTPYTAPIPVQEDTVIQAVSVMDGETDIDNGQMRIFRYRTDTKGGDRYEPNDGFEQAAAFSFPAVLKGTIHAEDDVDVYTFTLANSEKLSLTLTPPAGKHYGLTLYDGDKKKISSSEIKDGSQSIRVPDAGSGKYYVKVSSLDGGSSDLESYELSLKRELKAEDTAALDLSEMGMLRALNQKGSETAWNFGPDGGGHFQMSMAYFSSWEGPVLEEDAPYPELGTTGADLDKEFENEMYVSTAKKAQYHVQNALYMPNDTQEDFIANLKNAVYSYGAADIYVLWSPRHATEDNKNLYVEKIDWQYENPADPYSGGGHIITVVGWDDDYDKNNFTGNPYIAEETGVDIPLPKNNGAFICKNSWGEGAGEDGYFYLSYEDAYMTANAPAVFIADELPDAYNHQYINDVKGYVTGLSSGEPFAVGEVFECTEGPELLRAVSFQTDSANNHYEIFVRTERVTGKEPMQKVAEGTKKYAGFYTERLETPVLIEADTSFEVIIRMEGTLGSQPSIAASCDIGSEKVDRIPGKAYAYESFQAGEDIGIQGFYPCLRAYTYDVTTSDYQETSLESGQETKVQPEELSPRIAELLESSAPVIQEGETASRYGALRINMPNVNGAAAPVTQLPARFDLRDTGTMTPVRNQGLIGSCWTFAAIACVENNIARTGGDAVDYPSSLSLDKSQVSVLLGREQPEQTVNLKAELGGGKNPSSTRINWKVSGDADCVRLNQSVSLSGEEAPVLVAVKPGIVTVTAESDADMTVTASCKVIITAKGVETLHVTPDAMTLNVGETGQITAKISPADAYDQTVLYESDRPEIAYVDKNGLVTAASGGKAVITVRAGEEQATVEVTVKGMTAATPGAGTHTDTGITVVKSAETGDVNHIGVWIALLCTAGVGITGVIAAKRRMKGR